MPKDEQNILQRCQKAVKKFENLQSQENPLLQLEIRWHLVPTVMNWRRQLNYLRSKKLSYWRSRCTSSTRCNTILFWLEVKEINLKSWHLWLRIRLSPSLVIKQQSLKSKARTCPSFKEVNNKIISFKIWAISKIIKTVKFSRGIWIF